MPKKKKPGDDGAPLFNIPPSGPVNIPYHGHAPYHHDPQPTEFDAAASIDSKKGALQKMVFDWMKAAGVVGIMIKEACPRYATEKGVPLHTVRNTIAPRFTELVQMGYAAYDPAQRRNGCAPIVWTGREWTGATNE